MVRKKVSLRKRNARGGAPKGNQNARTHGFYSKTLDEDEKQAFQHTTSIDGLDNEIALVRVKLDSALRRDPYNFRLVLEGTRALANLLSTGKTLTAAEKKSLKEKIACTLRAENVPMEAGRENTTNTTNTTNNTNGK